MATALFGKSFCQLFANFSEIFSTLDSKLKVAGRSSGEQFLNGPPPQDTVHSQQKVLLPSSFTPCIFSVQSRVSWSPGVAPAV